MTAAVPDQRHGHMKISDLLDEDDVIDGIAVGDKSALLQHLAGRLAAKTGIDAGGIAPALLHREALGSTGIGAGVAVPHARMAQVTKPVGLFARLGAPIDWNAIDGRRVDLVFLLLLPLNVSGSDPVAALAAVARLFRREETLTELRKSRNAREAFAILCGSETSR